MTEKRDEGKVPDVRAVNPRYKAAKMSDVARALMRPKDPKVRKILERREAPRLPTDADA